MIMMRMTRAKSGVVDSRTERDTRERQEKVGEKGRERSKGQNVKEGEVPFPRSALIQRTIYCIAI